MRNGSIAKALGIFLMLVSHLAFAQKKEEQEVKKSFDDYKSAILNDKGEEAVNYVDSRTVKYYGDVLEWVKTADSTTVERMSILDKLMVFTIRHRTSREEILTFNGKALFVYAIKNGMVGKNSVANNAIGEVTIEDNFAKGRLVVNKQETPFYFHFYKEEGRWKIDLTSLFAISSNAFKQLVEGSGQSESEYLFAILEMLTGRKPGPEIWSPVN